MTLSYTITDISNAVCLSKQAIQKRANKEGWPSQQIGRGRSYQIANLPDDIRLSIARKQLVSSPLAAASSLVAASLVPAGSTAPAGALFLAQDLTDKQKLERDARSGVLAAVRRLQEASHCSQEAALTTLLTSARAGQLDAHLDKLLHLARDPRGRAGDGYPSLRTLKRWLGAGDLTPKKAQQDMRVPPWSADFLAIWQTPQKPSVEAAHRLFVEQWPGISVHQVRRWIAKLGTVTREAGRMGARELKNIRPFIRRDWSEFEPNDAWIADGHTFDAEVQHPLHGRPFRPEITVFIDGGTRRVTGWSLGLAENALGVADALASGVRLCGLPAIVYGDNGAGYRANLLTDEATGILGRIHATPKFALPYNSQAKGIVERLHATLWVAAAKELPTYIGAAMDREARLLQFKVTRKAIKHGGASMLAPWDVFVQFLEARVAAYNARPHRSLGGISPDGAWAAWEARGWQAERLSDAELADLFRPRIERVAQRGEINLFTNIYYSRQLEEFHGVALHIAYDIHDPQQVWVYAPDGRFVCEAEVNGNKRAAFPVPVVEQAREKRAKGRLDRLDTKRNEVLEELRGGPAIGHAPAPRADQIILNGAVYAPEKIAITPAPAPSRAEPAQPRSERPVADNYAEWKELKARQEAGETLRYADAKFVESWKDSKQATAHFKFLGISPEDSEGAQK